MTRSVVVETTLLVALLAGVAVSPGRFGLAAGCLVRGTTVGVVFLIGDYQRPVVHFQASRIEVVADLVADQAGRRGVGVLGVVAGARLDQRDAPLVVHDVQRLALQLRSARAVALPEEFKASKID